MLGRPSDSRTVRDYFLRPNLLVLTMHANSHLIVEALFAWFLLLALFVGFMAGAGHTRSRDE
jgi:hypothetical protein